ncbi:MAG TPA: phosphopantetheine-binding protein [Thermoanaerobaculia bacterium]|nr:phosphopantetheine-binding protein [Thermoanaerobaculia bacterium]
MIDRLKFEDLTPEDIGDDDPLFQGGLGLDSIDALEIVVMLESEFGIKVKNETSARDHFRSISTLAQLIHERTTTPQAERLA